MQRWLNYIWSHIKGEVFNEDPTDVISNNAKSVLIGLFILIGLAIIFYAITISADDFKTSDKSNNIHRALSQSPENISSINKQLNKQLVQNKQLQDKLANPTKSNNVSSQLEIAQEIGNSLQNQVNSLTKAQPHIGNLSQINEDFTDLQRRDQQLEQINSVFIAAIAGALALGGTLITQLWGRKD